MSLPFIILSTVVFITFVTSSAAHLNTSFNCKRPSLLMKPIMIVTKHDWHWLDNMNVPGCWMQTAFTPTTPTSDRTRDKATSLLWDTDNTGMTRSRVPQEVRCVSELSPAHVTFMQGREIVTPIQADNDTEPSWSSATHLPAWRPRASSSSRGRCCCGGRSCRRGRSPAAPPRAAASGTPGSGSFRWLWRPWVVFEIVTDLSSF